jgi:signal transduction histidine kinase
LGRWTSKTLEPRVIKLWNGQFIKLVDRRSQEGDTVSLALNITDAIRNEKQLKEAREKAEAANEAKSAFLAKMNHELRTPMNGVVGMADLLADSELSEEQLLFVDTIKSSGEALLELINDVLDFSKIEAARLVLHTENFDLERSIHDVVMLFQPAVQGKDVGLIVDYDMFLPDEYSGDMGRIRQILTNLVGNAVKFTKQGHVMIRVVGLPEGDGGDFRLHFTVEDTGMGIPEYMVDHIFGEFNQVEDEKNRSFEGTGLGLAITKQLIGLMGGDI